MITTMTGEQPLTRGVDRHDDGNTAAVASTARGPSTRCGGGIIGGDQARLRCSSVREVAIGTRGIVIVKLVRLLLQF